MESTKQAGGSRGLTGAYGGPRGPIGANRGQRGGARILERTKQAGGPSFLNDEESFLNDEGTGQLGI